MKTWAVAVLTLVIVAQFAAVGSLIAKHERVLREGTVHRFRTRPIDPADPFQGRYVQLVYERDYIPGTNENEEAPLHGEHVYVSLATDGDGFSRLNKWTRVKPDTAAFLKLRYNYPKREWNADSRESTYKGLAFDIPFDRFYMEESKAPQAELRVREATRNTNCWATVRILNGVGLIEDVYIEGVPLREVSERASR